jgi:16S rRNA (adenine1518-N6/adenine1519-N6)-dimethyltransferase
MLAAPGRLGLLGIGVQIFGKPIIIDHVPPGAFYPRPKVTSTIVRIDMLKNPLVPKENQSGFFTLVKAGFSAPRKQLGGVFRHTMSVPKDNLALCLAKARVDPKRRAESLSIKEWITLYQSFKESHWIH